MAVNYEQLPEELRWEMRWCLAGPDDSTPPQFKAPHAANTKGIFKISPTESRFLKDFETVCDEAQANSPCGIGFILNASLNYTCIDLDIKNQHNYPNDPDIWTPQENIDRFHQIIKSFDSYTERSASGQGFHIWVNGNIGSGVKLDGVEVYSQERFIVCTGDVYLDRPIQSKQALLNILVQEIKEHQKDNQHAKVALVELPETETDQTIFARARDADNGEKFIRLCEGEWLGEYPSQSEADLALLSIFTFYSKSNEQCRRMFRMTKLADRSKNDKNRHKHDKNNYHLDRLLVIIRSRQISEEKALAYAEASAAALFANLQATKAHPVTATAPPTPAQLGALPVPVTPNVVIPPSWHPNNPSPALAAIPVHPGEPKILPVEDPLPELEEDDEEDVQEFQEASKLEWPPGFVGILAQHIYQNAPRPVKEVAIVSALGFMAGICGKAWHIPQSGLNLYIVLIARSAIGKEAMHSGISNLINELLSSCPAAMSFVDFTDYASGPGLTKAVASNLSFVNVSGEWGRKLKRLANDDGRDSAMQALRTVMTGLYQKSGPGSIVGGIGYSDKEKNIASVSGAAYSMIGETTPETFYDSLTNTMMEDGFMSRFTVVEYKGSRPPANPNVIQQLKDTQPGSFIHLSNIIGKAVDLNGDQESIRVQLSEEAYAMLHAFDLECDTEINKTDDESWRQMWNRAHLKTYRIAAVCAVADTAVSDDPVSPIIYPEHVKWALDLIRNDIKVMASRISSGDVGSGDTTRERKLLSLMKKYMTNKVPDSYGVPKKMRADGVIPRKYLQISVQRTSSFTSHKAGSNFSLDMALKSLIDSGYIVELSKEKAISKYSFHGRCFAIVALPSSSQK